jgi:hypothetical protein
LVGVCVCVCVCVCVIHTHYSSTCLSLSLCLCLYLYLYLRALLLEWDYEDSVPWHSLPSSPRFGGSLLLLLLFQLDIALTNVYCQNITIGDIRGEYYQQEEARNTSNSNSSNTLLLLYRLAVDPYSMTCFTDYSYTYGGFLSNSGTARMQLTDNGVTMTFGVSSLSNSLSSNSSSNSSSSSLPPNETTVQSCEPRVVITDLQLSGGVESFIVQLFSEAVTNAVEGVVTSST